MQAEPGGREGHADQGGGILGEHRTQRGVGSGEHVVDEVPLHRVGLGLGLPDRLQERRSLQDEGDGQHDVADEEVTGRFGMDKFADALRDRDHRARHEQPERGEQRPHVRFPPVAHRVRAVGRLPGPAVGRQQEDLVARVGPGVRRLGHQGRRPGQHGGGCLGDRDQDVGGEGDQDGRPALRLARIARQRHRPEHFLGSGPGLLFPALLECHQSLLTETPPIKPGRGSHPVRNTGQATSVRCLLSSSVSG
jgi:hypothetical protein